MPPPLCNQLHGLLWPGSAVYRPETSVNGLPAATHPSWETPALSRPVLHQLGGRDYEGRRTQNGHLDFHTAPELLSDRTSRSSSLLLYVHRDRKDVTIITLPRTATSTFTDTAPELCLTELQVVVDCFHIALFSALEQTHCARMWNGYRNKSQHRKLTLEKKIRPPLLQGLEPATFQSRVRRSNH